MTTLESRALASLPPDRNDSETAHKCTDLANAHRIRDHFGERMLFVEGVGWHTWSPPWRLDELGARRIVHALGKIIAQEAADMAQWVAAADDMNERERRQKIMDARFDWAKQTESAHRIEAALRMAASLLHVKAEVLDANPMLLGTPSGVLELDNGQHRGHDPRDYLTKIAGCDFDSTATAPIWERFIAEIFADDGELIDYMQRLIGYMLSGQRGEHLLPIFWGGGANGKSTLLGTIQFMLGEYAGGAAPGLLIVKGGNEHPTGLADLQGRRLVIASETGEAGRLNEEQVKLLTGGDAITARRMRMDFYTFMPTHQIVLQTNHRPRVSGTDEGIWRRLRLIPFAVTIPKERRDPHLSDKLRAEAPGILTWAWQGWQKYREHGFSEPAAVRVATDGYRETSDVVGQFIAECCITNRAVTAKAGDLYTRYTQWCEATGERAATQTDFGRRLSDRGFEKLDKVQGARGWRGISILHEDKGTSAVAYLRATRGE